MIGGLCSQRLFVDKQITREMTGTLKNAGNEQNIRPLFEASTPKGTVRSEKRCLMFAQERLVPLANIYSPCYFIKIIPFFLGKLLALT